jgi:hypothetical protein
MKKITLQYNVQKTFYVNAKNENQALEKILDGNTKDVQSNPSLEDWEYEDTLECETVYEGLRI